MQFRLQKSVYVATREIEHTTYVPLEACYINIGSRAVDGFDTINRFFEDAGS